MPEPAEPARGTTLGRLFGEDDRELAWVGICNTARTRRHGLLGVREMGDDECILLIPCRSIHTMGMKMSIDVAYLDGGLRVLAMRPELPPGKMLLTRKMFATRSVVEAAAGAFEKWGLTVGEQLSVRLGDSVVPP